MTKHQAVSPYLVSMPEEVKLLKYFVRVSLGLG